MHVLVCTHTFRIGPEAYSGGAKAHQTSPPPSLAGNFICNSPFFTDWLLFTETCSGSPYISHLLWCPWNNLESEPRWPPGDPGWPRMTPCWPRGDPWWHCVEIRVTLCELVDPRMTPGWPQVTLSDLEWPRVYPSFSQSNLVNMLQLFSPLA